MILKIKLRPLSPFFFGGEDSFNEAGREEDRRSTYLLKSRPFPQQTGVLGLIRNQLLLQNDLLWDNSSKVTDRSGAKTLIGAHSFQVGYTGHYGVIQKVGPVLLGAEDDAVCLPAPLDDVRIPSENGEIPHIQVVEQRGVLLHKGYREKSGLYQQMQHPQKGAQPMDDIFITSRQVGITKAARPWGNEVGRRQDESGYYYQDMLSFRTTVKDRPFAVRDFVCFVKLADQVTNGDITYQWSPEDTSPEPSVRPYCLNSGLVEFGGERSTFYMQVETTDLEELPALATTYHNTQVAADLQVMRLVCLSPASVKLDVLRPMTRRIISKSITFRFLKSKIEETLAYQEVSRRGSSNRRNSLRESKRFQLLDRGSTIYFDPAFESQITSLFNQADFQNIGYNQYCIL